MRRSGRIGGNRSSPIPLRPRLPRGGYQTQTNRLSQERRDVQLDDTGLPEEVFHGHRRLS